MSGSQTDFSERKNSEARLLYDASHDKLTGLSNRAHLLDNLHKAIQRVREGENYAFAVLFWIWMSSRISMTAWVTPPATSF